MFQTPTTFAVTYLFRKVPDTDIDKRNRLSWIHCRKIEFSHNPSTKPDPESPKITKETLLGFLLNILGIKAGGFGSTEDTDTSGPFF